MHQLLYLFINYVDYYILFKYNQCKLKTKIKTVFLLNKVIIFLSRSLLALSRP